MPRLVWFVMDDGRSVIANCDGMTRERIERMIRQPEKTLAFTADDAVDRYPATSVRDFVLFDARMNVPAHAAIYNFVHLC
ncbi:MAG TPA: hypothetical protein VIL97_01870 [Thermoanaerobaculia bacterium]